MNNKPYRIIVWAPSNLGGACIREILRLPDFELVGVLGYSPGKDGKDIGTLLGLPEVGVKVTTDKEAIYAMEADCVLYTTAPPFDRDTMDNDVIRLLESGKNVVSATAFFYAPYQGQDYVAKFEEACRKGGVSLHGTGENGGFMLERLATTVTGLTNEVEHVMVRESVYVSRVPAETLKLYGFTLDPEEAKNGPVTEIFKHWMFVESVTFACVALFGRAPDRVEHVPVFEPSPEDVEAECGTIRKGTTRFIRHLFHGYLDGKVRVTIELLWYVRREDAPYGEELGDQWTIEVEGKPASLRLKLDAMASLKTNEEMHPGDPTIPGYYITTAVLLQAVPVVCAAPPGFVYATTFTNAVEDFHRLATRKTLVT
jgi:2,4-diaminopentanoate dehydrogenase